MTVSNSLAPDSGAVLMGPRVVIITVTFKAIDWIRNHISRLTLSPNDWHISTLLRPALGSRGVVPKRRFTATRSAERHSCTEELRRNVARQARRASPGTPRPRARRLIYAPSDTLAQRRAQHRHLLPCWKPKLRRAREESGGGKLASLCAR